MVDLGARSPRGILVIGAATLWVVGLLWTLQSKDESVGPSAHASARAPASPDLAPTFAGALGDEPVSEIHVAASEEPRSSARPLALSPAPLEPLPVVEPELPTYAVWFESERSLGVCKISYAGVRKTANLHVATRAPAGELAFGWECGKRSGRASIEVSPKKVNGVLFCSESGTVRVKTVRSKEGRCEGR